MFAIPECGTPKRFPQQSNSDTDKIFASGEGSNAIRYKSSSDRKYLISSPRFGSPDPADELEEFKKYEESLRKDD